MIEFTQESEEYNGPSTTMKLEEHDAVLYSELVSMFVRFSRALTYADTSIAEGLIEAGEAVLNEIDSNSKFAVSRGLIDG